MMKTLLLDDEPAGRRNLRKLLGAHGDIEIIGEVADVASALRLTEELRPDLAFLDVRLRGETAFDYVGQLLGSPPRFIFVTAHDSYAVRGFECNAMDYLLKPVLPRRLDEALHRVRADLAPRRVEPTPDDSVFLPFERTARLVAWQDVTHVESSGNYTRVHLADGDSALVLRPLKDWPPLFPKDMFVQAHRSFIVRVRSIQLVDGTEVRLRKLVLQGGAVVPVSRTCWPEVKAALLAWHPDAAQCLP